MDQRETNQAKQQGQQRASAWLSHGVEQLFASLQGHAAQVDFDVLIVGSGYGGAVAARELAGCHQQGRPVTVCVLERGKEYLPGSFPTRMSDLAGHVRISTPDAAAPTGGREGLFDLRIGTDVSALLANGLGGGSLINAGVMVRPRRKELAELTKLTGDLEPYYVRALALLGATAGGEPNTIERHAGERPLKYVALQKMAPRLQPADGTFEPAALSIAMRAGTNGAGIELDACTLCGDCATGCNFNAKESLDTNLLVQARRRGADIYTGATVLRIERDEKLDAWCVHVNYTDAALRAHQQVPYVIRARKLVLAAGTFGSTEILLRSQSDKFSISPRIGRQFSSNGDMIAVAYGQHDDVNALADEDQPPRERAVGPTITGMIDLPGRQPGQPDLLIEDMAVPAPLRRLFEEVATTANTLHELGRRDRAMHTGLDGERDPCAVDRDVLRRSAMLAVMGNDESAGALELSGRQDDDCGDGAIRVRWPDLRNKPLFAAQVAALNGAAVTAEPGANGTILPNPFWRMLPESMEFLLSNKRGPLLTVHPLGGCAIGANAATGVVNDCGQVFRTLDAGGAALFGDLVVLDGAIVPLALGVNPALTITALALRAVGKLREQWQWSAAQEQQHAPMARPRFGAEPAWPRPAPTPTQVQFVEQMSGKLTLKDRHGADLACMAEMSLHFKPLALAGLMLPGPDGPLAIRRRLEVDVEHSTLLLYAADAWDDWRRHREDTGRIAPPVLLKSKLSGHLDFLHREASSPIRRAWRGLLPWLVNRGLRDLWQWGLQRRREGGFLYASVLGGSMWEDIRRRAVNALALASHAGEVRLFDYTLALTDTVSSDNQLDGKAFDAGRIIGQKRFTYARAANPWTQLTRMALLSFPGLAPGARPELELDTGFLVRENVALFRILNQQDQPAALADVASLGGYLLRLLLTIHVWTLRKPDATPMRAPQRLPGEIPGLPRPEITELEVDQLPDGTPVHVRLTRYRRADASVEWPPVVMIHGYSASGITFAHPLVTPNLASHLWNLKRDVWIVDLRTSSGMPDARHPWTFEDVALSDIPAAIEHICNVTQNEVDIVAHCMGAAMLGMLILAEPVAGDRYAAAREALPDNIRRIVLSQVGPVVVFSQANIFRAYLMAYLRQILPLQHYEFRIDGEPSLMDELIDRALMLLPYPPEEYRIENPFWPWSTADFVRTRHRMDALYGRDFSLCNIERPVLDNIDDFFGPLNTETVAQAMHFSRLKSIANRAGRNVYVSRDQFKARWWYDTLSLHGEDNGLTDVATLGRMSAAFEDTLYKFKPVVMKGFGHQDCFIGRDAKKVFDVVADFLTEDWAPGESVTSETAPLPKRWSIRTPWTGPVRSSLASVSEFRVGAGSAQEFNRALLVAFLPVVDEGGHFRVWGGVPGEDAAAALKRGLQLFTGVSDENGWVELAPRTAPATADGLLMLFMYDDHPSFFMHAAPKDASRHPALRGKELTAELRRQQAGGGLPVAPPTDATILEKLTWDILDFIEAVLDDVVHSLVAELDASPSALLRPGLIEFSPPPPTALDGTQQLCFALASCQYPAGLLDQVPAFASFERLAQRLGAGAALAPKPEFLLLAGDQIYSDASAGLFDPSAADDRYVRTYEKLLGNRHVKSVLRRLPVYAMLDDHEIADNWEPAPGATHTDPRLEAGQSSYLRFFGNNAPRPWGAPDSLAYVLTHREFAFFVADTRTEREARGAQTVEQAKIMSESQFGALLDWLTTQHQAADPERPKFIVTPSILVPRRLRALQSDVLADRLPAQQEKSMAHRLRSDAWDGYPYSMHRLLGHIARYNMRNVVFLSGDEHLSCVARLRIRAKAGGAVTHVLSIHSSALYAPFPFANSKCDDLAPSGDRFDFVDPDLGQLGAAYDCRVAVKFQEGDGFALVCVQGQPGKWKVSCEFDRAVD